MKLTPRLTTALVKAGVVAGSLASAANVIPHGNGIIALLVAALAAACAATDFTRNPRNVAKEDEPDPYT